MTPPAAIPIEAILARTSALYSLPAVAMEVAELTDTLKVDTRTLKECIERDPALTAKLLRVVNSSLFGLSRKVENLTQAIALLGIKPLKLLVLGFSLPDELLRGLDAESLGDYWRGALTRAVAARQIAEQLWHRQGDEAFLVALLQDVGKLVLLQLLGDPYARFLSQVRDEGEDLVALERQSLGFDHRQLSARLLGQWKFPPLYTEVITAGRQPLEQRLSELATIIRLANLVAELVSQHRLSVLPELLEQGEATCGLTSEQLHELVAQLEPQVDQLAELLNIDVAASRNYAQLLRSAHIQLATVAEQAAGDLLDKAEAPYQQLLSESQELASSLRAFIESPVVSQFPPTRAEQHPASLPSPLSRGMMANTPRELSATIQQRVVRQLATVIARCRQHRRAISLLMIDPVVDRARHKSADVSLLLESLCSENQLPPSAIVPVDETAWALLLPGYERPDAVGLAQEMILNPAPWQAWATELKVGIATLMVVPKGFEPQRLLTAAEGCLNAARASGGSLVKSIEVY